MKKASCFQVKCGEKYFSSGDENNFYILICKQNVSMSMYTNQSVTYKAKHIKYYDWFMQ